MTKSDDKRREAEERRFAEATRELDDAEARQAARELLATRRRALRWRQVSAAQIDKASPVAPADAPDDQPEQPRWSAVKALVVSALLTVVVLACLVGLLLRLNETSAGPESALSLVFVSAAVVLILVVCTLTIVFKRLRLTDSEEAMGLPRGSIRAVIALLLILLFFIAAIFLYNSTRALTGDRSENRNLTGISAARYDEIPTDMIQSATPRTVGDALLYDVVLYPPGTGTPTSDDIAKQLITILGTLVTAVSAFYFGANSVKDARALGGRAPTALPPPAPQLTAPFAPVPAPVVPLPPPPPGPTQQGAGAKTDITAPAADAADDTSPAADAASTPGTDTTASATHAADIPEGNVSTDIETETTPAAAGATAPQVESTTVDEEGTDTGSRTSGS